MSCEFDSLPVRLMGWWGLVWNMGLMDWIGGNQHRQSGEGGGKDEDVGEMIEKWTGRLLLARELDRW